MSVPVNKEPTMTQTSSLPSQKEIYMMMEELKELRLFRAAMMKHPLPSSSPQEKKEDEKWKQMQEELERIKRQNEQMQREKEEEQQNGERNRLIEELHAAAMEHIQKTCRNDGTFYASCKTSFSGIEKVIYAWPKYDGSVHGTLIYTTRGVYYVAGSNKILYFPVYQFHAMITLKQLTALENFRKTGHLMDSSALDPSQGVMIYIAQKRVESFIRGIIPGSYQNGDWRQLDGFFGMYYNESTGEVSSSPPPSTK